MLLAAAVALVLQGQVSPDYRGMADRLSERLQWITSTIRDLREKKRVHAEALAEVEAYLAAINRRGTDLQSKAKQLEEMRSALAAKRKEFDAAETEYDAEKKLYDQHFERFQARGKELSRKWDALDAEIKAHNARKDSVTEDQAEAYRQNAARLNQVKAQLTTESDRHDNTDRPAVQAAYDKIERMRLNFAAVETAKIDLDNELRWDGADFSEAIHAMEGPAEALHSLLMEATGKRAASTAYRIFGSRREATAQTLAQAYGGGHDLPDTMLAEVYVIRAGADRGSSRHYIVERLKLGELIEGLRALTPESSEKVVAAEKAFEFPSLPGAASKPSALVKGAAWTMKAPDASTLKPQKAPALK